MVMSCANSTTQHRITKPLRIKSACSKHQGKLTIIQQIYDIILLCQTFKNKNIAKKKPALVLRYMLCSSREILSSLPSFF